MTKKPASTGARLNLLCLGGADVSGWTETPEAPDLKSFMRRSGSWRWRMTFSDEWHLQDPFAGARRLRDLL
jgi:hypothetical protein